MPPGKQDSFSYFAERTTYFWRFARYLYIRVSKDIGASTFDGSCYVLDLNTVCNSDVGDDLTVYGLIDEHTDMNRSTAKTTYCELKFIDAGQLKIDAVLRKAVTTFDDLVLPSFSGFVTSLSGISGAPVFNKTKNSISGMAMRAGLNPAVMYYIEMLHIVVYLQHICNQQNIVEYNAPIRNESVPSYLNRQLADAIRCWGLKTA